MKQISKLILIFLLVLPLTSCWDDKELEDLLLVLGIGVDVGIENPDEYEVTIEFPTIITDAPKEKHEISVNAKSLNEAKKKFQSKVYRHINYGNTRVLIFGSEVAKEGVIKHIDCLLREPIFPGTIRFAVANVRASDILKTQPFPTLLSSNFLFRAIQQTNERTQTTFTTLRKFHHEYYTNGIDPVLPYITFEPNKNTFDVGSVALFKEDKLVKVLDQQYTLYLMFLKGEINRGFYQTTYKNENNYLSINLKGGNSKIDTELVDSTLYINEKINIKADLAEFTPQKNVFDKAFIEELQTYLSNHLKERLTETVEILQELKTDSVGYGLYVRAKNPEYFDKDNWGEQLAKAKFNIEVNVEIRTVGITF